MKRVIFLFLLFSVSSFAQDIKLGAQEGRFNYQGGFYDFSDPRYLNIMVNIWGYVRFPGKYYVPEQSKIIDLISYAGGPTPDAHLDDVRLYRQTDKGSTDFIRFDIEDLMFKNKTLTNISALPQLKAGDIIVIPGEPRLYLRDYISIAATVTSTLVSILTFVLVVLKR
ncbi:MAG: SLBB domain-containing protein [Ignavibacteria bacterium]|nr:SLBB domain-containing protein [Ignavibacteria bacterium]